MDKLVLSAFRACVAPLPRQPRAPGSEGGIKERGLTGFEA